MAKKKKKRQSSVYSTPISEYRKRTSSNKSSSKKKSTSAKDTAKKQTTTSKNSRLLDVAPYKKRESSTYNTSKPISEYRKTTPTKSTSAKKTAQKQTTTSKNSRVQDVAPYRQRETSTYTTPRSDYNKRDKVANSTSALSRSKNSRVQDIAPVKTTTQKKKDDRTWFKKPKAFEDGYQFGDVTKTILGSATDGVENLASGVMGMGEKIVDATAYLAPGAYLANQTRMDMSTPDFKLYNEMQSEMDKFIKKDLYNEQAIARKIISDPIKKTGFDPLSQSVFGEKSDSLVQSAGQLGATVGLQALGVPWFATTGVTSFGGEVENAMKQGATYGEAGGSALISAGAEILSEKLSGGISFGGKTMDDVLVKNLTTRISDKTIRSLTKSGIDAVGEGSEEVISSVFSNLGSALYKEENIDELLTSEEAMDEYIESFIGGAVLGGGSSVVNATKSNAQGKDFSTGLSNNELKVAQREIADRIKEREADGSKVSTKEKNAITQQVYKDLEKGYISIDTIESTLGGETYKKYKDSVDNETKLQQEYDELNKMKLGEMTGEQVDRKTELKTKLDELKENSNTSQMREQLDNEMLSLTANDKLLQESYNERSRRGQTFEADLNKYDAKQQEIIKRATESGILNNTNRTHEFVDMVAKISADKGVLFDFTNNEKLKESGFAMDGKTINGYVKDGNIAVNINSNKALNTIVGHEITHVLEGTELYTELQNAVKEYATTKGEYQARYDAFKNLYKDVDGAVIDNEVTADLVGDYLFTDADFVSRLSVEKPNVFKKIYDEIKYFVKSVTSGKEARELEKVKRAFDKAYKESAKASKDTKYSVSDKNIKDVMNDYASGESYFTMSYTQDGKTVATLKYSEYAGEPNVKMIEVEPEYRRNGIGTNLLQELQRKYPDTEISFGMSTPDGTKLLESATYTVENKDVTDKFARIQEIQKVLDKYDEGYNNFFENDIEIPDDYAEDYNDLYDEKVALQQELRGKKKTKTFVKTDTKFSLSEDSEGNKLSDAQKEYFADSKIKDENGNLKIMYHGSQESFTVFDKRKAKSSGLYGRGFYFTESKSHAQQYGSQYEVYLNITNPIQNGTNNITKDQLRNFVEELAENEDYGIENYGYGATVDSVTDDVYGKDDFAMLMDLNVTCVGNMVEAIELFNEVNGTDYNGIVAPTETVAFYPNQIKKIDNQSPTSDADIRYSLSDDEFAPIQSEYAPLTEAEANERDAMQNGRLQSLNENDMPPEIDAPYYGENPIEEVNPFDKRDIKDVGKRDVKAYMYENPEVKPFFQAEAEVMLRELRDSTKGERTFNDQLYYDTAGEQGWFATKRQTSDEIAYLLDNFPYTYADIEKGLKAIIEDHGAENNAISKRIEFMIDERLREGYTDFTSGYDIPNNPDYIALLEHKQITEYNDEAYNRWVESLANVDFVESNKMADDIAPVRSDAIKPRPVELEGEEAQMAKNPIVRADSTESKPRDKQRKWVKTSTESEVVNKKIVPEDLDQSAINYQPIPNKKTLGKANSRLDSMGYDSSLAYFKSQFERRDVKLEDVALGERLIQEAMKKEDYDTARELIQDVSILGTELGQKVQALSIIQRLTPEGQLRNIRRVIERGTTRGDKAFEGVKLTPEMEEKILKARKKDGTFDQKELNKAVEDVKQELANQMKVTMTDKVNAWRYLSMLGNPKTHIRNMVSNIAMKGTLSVKNAVARSIEGIAPVKGRTKTWESATDEVKAFAHETMKELYMDIYNGEEGYQRKLPLKEMGGKYNDATDIKSKRAVFKNKILNGLYEFNSDMLAKEDWWFSKSAFEKSFREFLTANGIKTKEDIQNNLQLVEKGKRYATEQAQIATFQQYSWLANKIGDIERKNALTNMAVGAVVPFKKTPINIAKTGLNYSPLGFAKTLTYDISEVKKGNMEASTLVDHLAQNVTGSALTLVGYMLAQSGFLNGSGDDDKEGTYDYQLGKQSYSINIGDGTYSLSWLTPVAMPLFVGANAYGQLVEGQEWNGDVVVETLAQTLDPLSEMSFLSSLDSVLSSYDSGIKKFAGIGETMIQNYATQFIPTLSSQVASTMDDKKRSTKVSGDSGFKMFEETLNKLKYKIPGLRETLEPTIDIWGNDVKQNENLFGRAMENFIAPYSRKASIATSIDEELKDVYAETGEDELLPTIPYNYLNYNGEKYKMSAKEYTEYKQMYGQTANDMLYELFHTTTYQISSPEEKTDMIERVYDYARDEANRDYLSKEGVDYTNATKDGKEYYREDAITTVIADDIPLDEATFKVNNPEKYDFFKQYDITYREYKNSKENEDTAKMYDWAYQNPEYFQVARAISNDLATYWKHNGYMWDNIRADKDANGNSIPGTKKEKIIEYINGIESMSYEEKLVLFKKYYPADDSYNNEIIDYLNSRDDISYEEMVMILEELDFEVDEDGYIYW